MGAMAKNGALFKQLLDVYEFYLKELKGRVGDLETVNNSFYTNKGETANKRGGGVTGKGTATKTKEEEKGDKEREEEEDDDGYEVGFHSRDRTGSTFFNLESKELDEDVEHSVDQKHDDKDKQQVEQLDEWTTLKKTVNKRHDEVKGQFKTMANTDSEETTSNGDSYNGGNKEKAALDANAEKVRQIREGLLANNGDWRQMIDTVSTDYDGMSVVKKDMVNALTSSAVEMKVLLDLVIKIPRRKILEPIAGADAEAEPEEEQPASEREQ